MPEDRQLAKDFADYFQGKIGKIRENFTDKEPYKLCQLEIPQLTKFAPVTEQDLGKLITIIPAKSWQLDVIPTDKLKQVLDQCTPAIMYITNLSLQTSEFYAEWKEALVKPFIKK